MNHCKKRRQTMTTINVQGMSCEHCVQAVTTALKNIPALENITVDLKTGTAAFTSSSPVDMDAIHAAIQAVGFETAE